MNLIYDPWPKEFADKIWSALVEHVGAREDDRDLFIHAQMKAPPVSEWRFMGILGFGGKVYRGTRERRVYVDYYQENRTPDRDVAVERCNIALQTLVDEELNRREQEAKK